MGIASYIDHTLLKADATAEDIRTLVNEGFSYSFHSVCVNSSWVGYVRSLIPSESTLKITSVVGFPLGAMSTEGKIAETEAAIRDGADEIDMVVNIGRVKSGDIDYVERELSLLRKASEGHVLKVILETCLLTKDEIVKLCKLAEVAGAVFVKTSTGFSIKGASAEDVALLS